MLSTETLSRQAGFFCDLVTFFVEQFFSGFPAVMSWPAVYTRQLSMFIENDFPSLVERTGIMILSRDASKQAIAVLFGLVAAPTA